jgi:hypothetical protein
MNNDNNNIQMMNMNNINTNLNMINLDLNNLYYINNNK